MPTPKPGSETRQEFMDRCIPMMVEEGNQTDQAVAICSQMWDDAKSPKVERAYSWLSIRSIDAEERIVEGIATTPVIARDGDVLETNGILFKLPIPFMYRHKEPLGNVVSANVSDDGIRVRIQVGASGIAQHIDEAWRMIKAGIVRGLSIGWRTLEEKFDPSFGGYRIGKSEWLELSAVPVAADQNAAITSVRSADEAILAALGDKRTRSSVVRLHSNLPGVSGSTRSKGKVMTIAEQITQFDNKRAASTARMDAIMKAAGEAGATLDVEQQEEYDTLDTEVKSIDEHLVRLRAHEKRLMATATTITVDNTADQTKASQTRGGEHRTGIVTVKSNLPKGTTFSRWVMAQVEAKGDKYRAADMAKQFWPDQPEIELILRAGVNAGTTTGTTWAAPLIPPATLMINEFLELLRPATIIGRIPNLNHVPANVTVPLQTGGGTGNWVGETAPKPVSAQAFTSVTLRWAKAVVLCVLSQELIRFSTPNAEAVVRSSMIKDLAQFLDTQFVSTTIESVNISPAGILWNAPTSAATGVTAAFFLTDFKTALASFIAANYDLSQLVILMSSTVALNVSTLKDSLGNFIYPTLGLTGGTILNIPVVVSEAVGNKIIFLNANEILIADDGGLEIDASNQASILMDDAPAASPMTTSLVSLYQRNLVAIKVEQFITWKKARSTSVYYLTNASYTG